jgi:hypothetical protein
MSKLLIQESPLTFQPSLASAIGLNEAIVLQQIHYWISNQKNRGYEQDGHKWVYNTYAEWKENNFPFWSEATIQRVFSSLEDAGLVVSIQPMKGRYDRTKYYRIDYSKLDTFDDSKLIPSDDSKLLCSLNESENTAENTTSQPAKKTDEQKPPYVIQGIEASIYSGRPTTQADIDATNGNQQTALDAFQTALQTPLNWNWYPAKTTDEKTWSDFRKFITDMHAKDSQCFSKYQTWRTQPYARGAMSNLAIKRNPENFPASWSDFLASDSMYGKKDEPAAPTVYKIYNPDDEPKRDNIPAPENLRRSHAAE